MAQYEHLPIYKKAMDLTIFIENVVRGFSRYNKYTMGMDLRNLSREMVRLIIQAISEKSIPVVVIRETDRYLGKIKERLPVWWARPI